MQPIFNVAVAFVLIKLYLWCRAMAKEMEKRVK
jgi:hypothetical protein